jgi:glutathione synthase/RimK-type ligase-like ATP-grasp enzyme
VKIGIHDNKGSFSDRWIAYCKESGIEYKIVDCFRNDIINQLDDCDALMWHSNQNNPKASKFSKQLLFSVQAAGKKAFPDYNTVWHFDDKVGQKYLLEAIGAPLAPTYVFYSKKEALDWADKTIYPKVFKLRNGAGSQNVRLVSSKYDAFKLINRAFGRGFNQYDPWSNLKERIRRYRSGKTDSLEVIKGIARFVYPTEYAKVTGREKGYIYFQDYINSNGYDIRIIVIGNKAFGIKRLVRENDFRASGSGFILYEKDLIDDNTVRLAFGITDKLHAQCMTYDFVYNEGNPVVLEISYGFSKEGYDACQGYWDKDLKWYPGKIEPQNWMVDLILES